MNEIVVMRNAGIAQLGEPLELCDGPADRFVADFIGEANIIPCEVVSVKDDIASICAGDLAQELPARGLKQGRAGLAVRPTRFRLGADEGMRMTVDKVT